jgi:hypothetical protein
MRDQSSLIDTSLAAFFEKLGIRHKLSAPGHPESQGLVERVHSIIRYRLGVDMGTAQAGRTATDWDEWPI